MTTEVPSIQTLYDEMTAIADAISTTPDHPPYLPGIPPRLVPRIKALQGGYKYWQEMSIAAGSEDKQQMDRIRAGLTRIQQIDGTALEI